MANEAYILKHYKKIAKNFGLSGSSTIQDPYIRSSELDFFVTEIRKIIKQKKCENLHIVDLGCGNGILLERLVKEFPLCQFYGLEFTPELFDLAKSRELPNTKLIQGSIKDPHALAPILNRAADIIITERVIINLLSWKQQSLALQNISHWLAPQGSYLFSESFKEPWFELNTARRQMSLPPIEISKHNRYLNSKLPKYLREIDLIAVPTTMPTNFLSTHFYLSRVLHPAIRPEGGRKKESHFTTFFNQALPAAVGNYSPILFYHYLKDRNSATENAE